MGGSNKATPQADFVSFAHEMRDLSQRDRHIELSEKDLALLNPNTRTCPIFRTRRDAELSKAIYRRVPVLIDKSRTKGGNAWGVRLGIMFHQSADARLFTSAETLESEGFHRKGNRWLHRKDVFLPLYEAKMVQAYDHRAAGVVTDSANWVRHGQTEATNLVSHQNPEFTTSPRFWVAESEVAKTGISKTGMVAYKNVTSATNQRTMIAAFLPYAAYVDSINIAIFDDTTSLRQRACLLANMNSLPYDYVARQKVGGLHLSYFVVEQLPTFPPDAYDDRCPWDKKRHWKNGFRIACSS